MAEYNPFFGIYVDIDKVSVPITKDPYYYFVTVCLSPPANYYTKNGDDLDFIYKIELNPSRSQ